VSKDFVDNQKKARKRRGKLQAANQEVPLKDQIPAKLRGMLEDLNIGQQVVEKWNTGNADRQEALDRRRRLLTEIDEFINPIYVKPQEWMSDLHLPVTFTICKTFHARMLAAISQDTNVMVKSRQEANSERAPMIQDLMRYTEKDWANNYQGIEDEKDKFVWEWCTAGRGIFKLKWDRQFTRFVDVV
jgi:hypothetical protein